MNTHEMAQKAADLFKTGPSQYVDILYATSDGEFALSPGEASKHVATKNLADKAVTPYYRDAATRDLANKYKKLNDMVQATDFLKYMKAKKIPNPTYDQYLQYADAMGAGVIEDKIFEFIRSKVYYPKPMTQVGLRDTIFTFDGGIVTANFIRQFSQGKVWVLGDKIILTCPTHTELMSGTLQDVFKPMLDPYPNHHQRVRHKTEEV